MLKRIISLCGGLCVATVDGLQAWVAGLRGRHPKTMCVVLAYHSVRPQERARFARQMDDLVRYAKPVRPDVKSLPADGNRYAVVTFDDGLENIIGNALPELNRARFPRLYIHRQPVEFLGTNLVGIFRRQGSVSETAMSEASFANCRRIA